MALPDGTAARWIMKGVSPPDPSPDLPMPQSLAATCWSSFALASLAHVLGAEFCP